MTTSGEHDAEVVAERTGSVGTITLNRPRAINALTLGMVDAVAGHLDRFQDDPEVSTIVLSGRGDRGFCAGGDMRAIWAAGPAASSSASFFRREYQLNAAIARSAKPVVALMDSLVLGGGVGLGGHASVRVVNETSRVGFPEVNIGFTPDVGGSWLLSRDPGGLGTFAALTGTHLGAGDALALGLADHHIRADAIEGFLRDLHEGANPHRAAQARHVEPSSTGSLRPDRDWIDDCFRANSVAEICGRLRAGSERSRSIEALIRSKSPIALAVTLRSLREAARSDSLEACLNTEYRLACSFLETPDFFEGIRAVLVDKDQQPRWEPATIEAVTGDAVDAFFAGAVDEVPFPDHDRGR